MTMVPDEYTAEECSRIDDEFKRVKDTAYLDHAGATLYSERQLADVHALLSAGVFGNPHTTKRTEDLIDQVRYRVLRWLNAPQSTSAADDAAEDADDEYAIVFTSGATAALKLVAECFAFDGSTDEKDDQDQEATVPLDPARCGQFVHLTDNHTSVLGMRAVVRTPHIRSLPRAEFMQSVADDENISVDTVDNATVEPTNGYTAPATNSLFVYPGQCNFSGFKYPLIAIDAVQRRGPGIGTPPPGTTTNWFVFLDAASLCATSPLDLRLHRPDFVCLSFYKLFGYPTGLGALLVSRRGQSALRKRYYGGGTVRIALASRPWHRKRLAFHERFEDGTLPFLSIAALLAGFDALHRMVPPSQSGTTMQRIAGHCFGLTRLLRDQLLKLRHPEGEGPVVQVYADSEFAYERLQGGILAFNVLRPNGTHVGFREVAEIAEVYGVALRTGCFCNPGACQRLLGLSDEEVRGHFRAGHVCGDAMDLVDGVPTGAVRVSVGYMTRRMDVELVVRMLKETYVTNVRRAVQAESTIGVSSPTKATAPSVRILQICVYPIKSCAPHSIEILGARWPLTERGLLYDREWMIVSARTGVALTQKSNVRLCLVRPQLDVAAGRMRLRFGDDKAEEAGDAGVSVPIDDLDAVDSAALISSSLCQSKVCGDRVDGADCGDAVAAWLSDRLGETADGVRLIRQRPDDQRRSKSKADATIGDQRQRISLANKAPFLLISTASIDWLCERVDAWYQDLQVAALRRKLHRQTIDRFRANLVIEAADEAEDSLPALAELEWRRLRSANGSVRFGVQGPCTRCQMICIDQASGDKTAEPLRTIAKVFGGRMQFGVYLEYGDPEESSGGYLQCGERLEVEQ